MKKDIEKELNQRSVFFGIDKKRGFRLQSPSRALQFQPFRSGQLRRTNLYRIGSLSIG